MAKMASMIDFQLKSTADEIKRLHHISQKKMLMITKTFGEIFCGPREQKQTFLKRLASAIKLTQHFREGISY